MQVNGDVSPGSDEAAGNCLHKMPKKRYSSDDGGKGPQSPVTPYVRDNA
jgi:hypothetical protein